jgi:hypothetical protein
MFKCLWLISYRLQTDSDASCLSYVCKGKFSVTTLLLSFSWKIYVLFMRILKRSEIPDVRCIHELNFQALRMTDEV